MRDVAENENQTIGVHSETLSTYSHYVVNILKSYYQESGGDPKHLDKTWKHFLKLVYKGLVDYQKNITHPDLDQFGELPEQLSHAVRVIIGKIKSSDKKYDIQSIGDALFFRYLKQDPEDPYYDFIRKMRFEDSWQKLCNRVL
jgi:hypothetical protein